MEGAGVVGDMLNRVTAAQQAGCDMLLVCNAPDAVAQVLENWKPSVDAEFGKRIEALIPLNTSPNWEALQALPRYRAALK